ncbi:PREDICTED: ABC transporter [Prunus dulcis]|uniref:PREDICTED: ABC transporter n=1 Tax=Prunus dulcis TaxID=3755 RepID=A0A5E4GE27_PRUDU|nr:PREDICTED: ABC transporter [Prunus dulcis]
MELLTKAQNTMTGKKTQYRIKTKKLCYRLSSTVDQFKWLFKREVTPKAYILKNVNFEARPGEITAIAGASGAGKTTLLEIVAGMIPLSSTAGQVIVNDQPMNAQHFRRVSGYVTQEEALFPLLTVEETLLYSARLRFHGVHQKATARVSELLRELALQHVADVRIGSESNRGISGGEKRRVSIGVDLVHDPAVLLLDEPTSGLDSSSALDVALLLKTMASTQGFVLGTIFMNAANDPRRAKLQTQIGFFAFSLTFLMSSATEGLPIYLQERRILMRETSRGAYRISSYVISNTLVFLPFLLGVALLYATPVYWLVGLRREIDGFLYFSLVVWMVILMSNSLVACFSALVPNFIMGTSLVAGLMGSFFLFSGFFIPKEDIPSYWTFMHYLSLFKYPLECFLINEYGGEQGRRRCLQSVGGDCILYGDWFLMQQGLKPSQKWINLGIMLGFIIGYRWLGFLILWYRSYRISK